MCLKKQDICVCEASSRQPDKLRMCTTDNIDKICMYIRLVKDKSINSVLGISISIQIFLSMLILLIQFLNDNGLCDSVATAWLCLELQSSQHMAAPLQQKWHVSSVLFVQVDLFFTSWSFLLSKSLYWMNSAVTVLSTPSLI